MNERIDGIAVIVSFCSTVLFTATAVGFFFGARWGLAFMAFVSLVLFIVLLLSYVEQPTEPTRRGRNG